ncbi:UMP kinase [Candidatus Dependentiae bacterium]|nr:MAG: UMP kinase [Candidatus Dependentiae bacterium]
MSTKKRILLKLTGEVFLDPKSGKLSTTAIKNVITQIKRLENKYQFGIVTGGGNFFRGEQGKQLGITPWCAHQIGMLATMMNGIMINNLLKQQNIISEVFNAIVCQGFGMPISYDVVQNSLKEGKTLIFVGGTGNPFFTTDTNAVLRALQIGADEIWKGTDVAGVYSNDPHVDPSATFIKDLTYQEALNMHLGVMDATAFTLASVHKLTIRIFNIFADNALLQTIENKDFGSIIHP